MMDNKIFDYETLLMLFDETGLSFAEWSAVYKDYASMTDQQIYQYLPDDINAILGEVGIHASWMHDGM